MPEFSEKLLQFKKKVEKEHDRVESEIKKLRAEIEKIHAKKNEKPIQAIASDDSVLDNELQRLRELLSIQMDHKSRLNAEILRISARNPGLLRPEFEANDSFD